MSTAHATFIFCCILLTAALIVWKILIPTL